MKFISTVVTTNPDQAGTPPPELYEAIGKLAAETGKEVLLDTGSMKSLGAMKVEKGNTIVDGPYTEAKEAVGGYAIFELPSEQAMFEYCEKFIELHRRLWPAWEGTVTVQQLMSMGP
ncbi:MAG TPA: hypothetical protein GYA10_17090 [Alphaproteobacteria bacterium]|nr:hypothetical protein [Alphaproteobacteria bacterium]